MSFEIERLVGGLTPANPADPRTFPAIWNDTADEIEAVEGRVATNEGDISSLDGRVTTAEGDIGQLQTDITQLDLDDLTDVDTDGKGDGDLLRYDATAGEWVPATLEASDLTDVDTSSASEGDLLRFDGASWGPDTLDTDDVDEGTGNLYYTDERVQAVIAGSTTDDLDEGTGNLYYTDERAEAAAPVQSVNTQTGAVSLAAGDVGALPDDAGLGDLDDVDLTGVADGNIIQFDATAGEWKPAAPAGVTTADITALDLVWNDF